MKKILVVLTNNTTYGTKDEATGLWLSEATEFVEEAVSKGFEIDYVSPNGGFVPLDPRSMKYAKESDLKHYNSSDFQQRALMHSLKPTDVKPEEYVAIYYTGGHGVMWDFPENETLQKIAATIYLNGGYIASVCHGIAGLLNIKDSAGFYLIKGKKITGFTATEELLSGKRGSVPFLNKQVATQRGAYFKQARPFKSFVLQDGRLITGQNPFSTKELAIKLLSQI